MLGVELSAVELGPELLVVESDVVLDVGRLEVAKETKLGTAWTLSSFETANSERREKANLKSIRLATEQHTVSLVPSHST
jgi:hypothetical protein